MSKRVQEKIKNKHSDVFKYTENKFFSLLQNNTIASFGYGNCKNTINFIAHLEDDNRYILYSLKVQKNHTICSTIYSIRKDILKQHYAKKDFKLLRESYKERIEEYITNQVQ